MLVRTGYTSNYARTPLASSQTMLRPFHSSETQAKAERRLKLERCSYAASKAGFHGQLRHLNHVQQQLQSMQPPPERSSSEACLDHIVGECRWSMLPGSAPASLRRPGQRGFTKGGRRRRPVHVIPTVGEEDPRQTVFCEDPEDPRVYLPAHRIGDALPETVVNVVPKKQAQPQAARSPPKFGAGLSKSMPTLQISESRLPLQAVRGGCWLQGNGSHGGAGGAAVTKLLQRGEDDFEEERLFAPASSGVRDDHLFPKPPLNCGGIGDESPLDDDDDEEYLPD